MSAAHTPGPWLVHFAPNCWTVVQDGSSGRWQVAGGTAWGQPALAEQAKANGLLVAAAPELLEAGIEATGALAACVDILKLIDSQKTAASVKAIHDRILAAIVKATTGSAS